MSKSVSLRNEVLLNEKVNINEMDQLLEQGIRSSVRVPAGLADALQCNPHLAMAYPIAVAEAVRLSFLHPDTQMRVLTQSEITRRVSIVELAMTKMYVEQGFGLRQCFDLMFEVLVRSLREAKNAEVKAAELAKPGRWLKDTAV